MEAFTKFLNKMYGRHVTSFKNFTPTAEKLVGLLSHFYVFSSSVLRHCENDRFVKYLVSAFGIAGRKRRE